MTKSQERFNEINSLIKKHKIKAGLIAVALDRLLGYINSALHNGKYRLSENMYKIIKSAINKILADEIPKEDYTKVIEYHEPSLPNINAVKKFMHENNITFMALGSILGMSRYQAVTYLRATKRNDISNKERDELLYKLNQHLQKQKSTA